MLMCCCNDAKFHALGIEEMKPRSKQQKKKSVSVNDRRGEGLTLCIIKGGSTLSALTGCHHHSSAPLKFLSFARFRLSKGGVHAG